MNLSSSTAEIIIRDQGAAPPGWDAYVNRYGYDGFHLRSEWSRVFSSALGHQPHLLTAFRDHRIVGVLPLMSISGPLFGRFLVSQPYLNTGGVLAENAEIAAVLIDRACQLADALGVRHLELRHETHHTHTRLTATNTEKIHLRMKLPATCDELWAGLKSKLRSQIRKPLADASLTTSIGRVEELDAFYSVFCRNMRDLGTPPFSRELFRCMLLEFGDRAEIVTIRRHGRPIASGFLLHAPQVTLIPSASSLRAFNATACNMLLYWHCLQRSVSLGQQAFDFGRSSRDSGTHRFKLQWGAEEFPAVWQYYLRSGSASDMRPSEGRFRTAVAVWQRLPVWLTRLIGPAIVRGIP